MRNWVAPRLPAAVSKGKQALCRVSLMALGLTFDLCSQHVPAMAEEIADWEEGRRVGIGVLPKGPYITIVKEGERIRYLGTALADPHISILFKNLDSAVLIFTAQLGAPQAVAENRVCVHGNNTKALQVTRAMAIVQTYLFPGPLLTATFKRKPVLTIRQMATKAKILGLLVPNLALSAWK